MIFGKGSELVLVCVGIGFSLAVSSEPLFGGRAISLPFHEGLLVPVDFWALFFEHKMLLAVAVGAGVLGAFSSRKAASVGFGAGLVLALTGALSEELLHRFLGVLWLDLVLRLMDCALTRWTQLTAGLVLVLAGLMPRCARISPALCFAAGAALSLSLPAFTLMDSDESALLAATFLILAAIYHTADHRSISSLERLILLAAGGMLLVACWRGVDLHECVVDTVCRRISRYHPLVVAWVFAAIPAIVGACGGGWRAKVGVIAGAVAVLELADASVLENFTRYDGFLDFSADCETSPNNNPSNVMPVMVCLREVGTRAAKASQVGVIRALVLLNLAYVLRHRRTSWELVICFFAGMEFILAYIRHGVWQSVALHALYNVVAGGAEGLAIILKKI